MRIRWTTGILSRRMKRVSFCLAVLLLLTAGCGKPKPAAVVANPADANAAPESPRAPGFLTETAAVAVVNDTGQIDNTLAQLTAELRKYVIETRSVPRDFEEFATKSHLQAPAPPAGKKYAIHGQAVVLVRR